MELIILIPAVVCILVLARGSMPQALVNVYLPVLLLLPQYFKLRFAHLPPLNFADTAILPLGVDKLGRVRRPPTASLRAIRMVFVPQSGFYRAPYFLDRLSPVTTLATMATISGAL